MRTTVVMISFAELDTGVHCCTVKTELDVSQKEHGGVQWGGSTNEKHLADKEISYQVVSCWLEIHLQKTSKMYFFEVNAFMV